MSRSKPIFLDIETGGIDPSQSSILTIAAGEHGKVHSSYIRPVGGTFLSRFSEEKILPQLSGKPLTSEKAAIESLILQLSKNPHAPLAGYNIRGFDVGFLQRRARIHGLESSWTRALGKREIQDPVFQVKDIIASKLSEHADLGTFNQQLGNRTWDMAESDLRDVHYKKRPAEYNLLSQVKGYLKASRETAMFKGWKLEDIHKILETHGAVAPVAGAAHDAAVDLVMTENVINASRLGKLGDVFSKPEAALQWMDIVKSRGYHQFGEGRLLAQADVDQMFPTLRSRMLSKRGMVGIGIAAAAVAAGIAFSGRDDNYNTIEGLGHGNMAQQGRLKLTDFGSGWQGILHGIVDLMEFVTQPGMLIGYGLAASAYIGKKYAKARGVTKAAELGGKINLSRRSLVGTTAAAGGMRLLSATGMAPVDTTLVTNAVTRLAMAGSEVPTTRRRLLQSSSLLSVSGKTAVAGNAAGLAATSALVPVAAGLALEAVPVAQKVRLTRRGLFTSAFSGRDDAANTIEGLAHGGLAQVMRKDRTPFGSGWDALRGLVKAGETFEKMITRKSFKQALSQAETVQVFGQGGMGTATMMKATYRGKEFNFIRKTGQIGEHEARTMVQFEKSFAPTLYGGGEKAGVKYLDMEMFQGGEFKDLAAAGRLTPEHVTKYEAALREMHKKGIIHGDAHARNAFVTPEGNVGLIDFGLSGKLGTDLPGPMRPGGDVGKILHDRKMGFMARSKGKEYWGFFTSREMELDTTAIEAMRQMQKTSATKHAQLQVAKDPTQVKTQLVDAPPTIHGLEPKTLYDRDMKSMRRADLNRSAAANAWVNGKNGGKRSRT